jgi:hypothetical protein
LPPDPKVGPHNAILDFTTLRTATTAPCDPSDPTNLCLGAAGRFKVQVLWTAQGQSGKGEAFGLTSDTGGFWFFSPTNIEMLVKVLDGCALGGHFWFFAAGLTNVEVAITVTDLSTHTVRQYESRAGRAFQPIQDTAAFACN